MDLRSDARIVGAERAVGEPRAEAADIGIEALGPPGVDRVVLGLDIGEIRPEYRLAAEVLAVVGAERAWDRRGIDQMFERGAAGQAKIDSLAQMACRNQRD